MWIDRRAYALEDRCSDRGRWLGDALDALYQGDCRLTRRPARHRPVHLVLRGLLRARQGAQRRVKQRNGKRSQR